MSSKTIEKISSKSISIELQRDLSHMPNEQHKNLDLSEQIRNRTAAVQEEKRVYALACFRGNNFRQ